MVYIYIYLFIFKTYLFLEKLITCNILDWSTVDIRDQRFIVEEKSGPGNSHSDPPSSLALSP